MSREPAKAEQQKPDGYMVLVNAGCWVELTGKYLDEALSRGGNGLRPFWLTPPKKMKG